jgi:glyoxylase-like metal-dependent hydrolase (beta-lactamase superfamily II)
VIVIPAGNPSQWTGPTGNNTYLFTGRRPALIDAGVGNPAHLGAIASSLQDRALELILLTHAHSDHASGVPALLERWPRAVVRPTSKPLSDGEAIDAGDRVLIAVHTPGHSPDHFCFLDRETNDVFCGDLARLGGTIVIPASRGGDLRAYLASLQRIRELRPSRLWPGHGPVVDDPLRLIDQYVEHRRTRDAQIVDALRRGLSSRAEIVKDVYPRLPDTLTAAASESVLAHLRKLEQDSVVRVNEERWSLVTTTSNDLTTSDD